MLYDQSLSSTQEKKKYWKSMYEKEIVATEMHNIEILQPKRVNQIPISNLCK